MSEKPTSIRIACGKTSQALRKCAFQIAVMIISACLVCILESGVRELQLVTVAPALIQSAVIGFPTILLLQSTTTFFPAREI